MRARSCALLALPALAGTFALAGRGGGLEDGGHREVIAIEDVSIIPMDRNEVVPHQTVIVDGDRITAIGPERSVPIPRGARRIDGRNRFLMPALTDMHVHLRAGDVEAYLASGVGTVRNMWGHQAIGRLRREIESGARRGPRIHSASHGLDGTPPQWPATVIVTAAESAAVAVQREAAAEEGWEFIKVYSRLSPAVFDAIMREVRERGLVAVGHVPLAVDVRHALASGLRSVEHLTGYDRAVSVAGRGGTWAWIDADTARFAELIAATRRAGAWNCPTMTIYATLARQHSVTEQAAISRHRRLFVRQLRDAQAPILAGTDAGIQVVPPGTSMHDELRELVAAGLTPFEALRAATVEPARFFGDTAAGVVRVGAHADLLLLDGNPLDDIANSSRIRMMFLRGEEM
ncbi:MAG TPA: amidohydrolase family protein [Gemmatimonadales bacterium]|nr:amidohydrolase family protein [Gemmatimonadales bacterium]